MASAILFMSVLLAHAQENPDAGSASDPSLTLATFEGQWISSSDALGGPGHSTMTWSSALDGRFLQLDYRIGRQNEDGVIPLFSGMAMYPAAIDGETQASWADSNGDLLPIKARIEGNALIAHWGGPDSSRTGMSRYEMTDDGRILVSDYALRDGEMVQFNSMEFDRMTQNKRHVTGIGGLFFRGTDPQKLTSWYEEHFAINPPPRSYDQEPWKQDEGYTVFGVFDANTEYFGDQAQQWMINLRVQDLDGLISSLRAANIDVSDPEQHPNGRFSRLTDPEGNPIELWEPATPE